MPRTPEQQRGLDFEQEVADILGCAVVPGSGNKFYAKNDCVGNGLSVSCKAQAKYSWPEIKEYLWKSIEDAIGSGNIGILALQLDGLHEDLVVMRLTDLAKAFSDDIKIQNSKESKGLEKRKKADIPLMLR